jgi:hypothetical protein
MSVECTHADCPRRQAQGEGISITSPAYVHKFMHFGHILGSGVDSLVLALDMRWRGTKFFEKLDELQKDAKFHKRPATGQLETKDQADALMFEVAEHGAGGYRWIVSSTEWTIRMGTWDSSHQRPNTLVKLHSESLWLHGVVESIDRLFKLLESVEGFVIRARASRVDICTDIQIPAEMWHKDLLDHVVGHIQKRTIHLSFKKLEGFQIGKGKFTARLYDKPLEIAEKSHKDWFFDLWKIKEVPEDQRVIRVEFQVRREGLKELAVDTIWDFINHPRSLWDYCAQSWLNFVLEPATRTRVLLPFWEQIQNGFMGGQSGAPFIRAKMVNTKKKQLDRQLLGQASSLVAMSCETSHPSLRIEDHSNLLKESAERVGMSDAVFSEKVRAKLAKRPRDMEKFDMAQAVRASRGLPQVKNDDGTIA